MISSFLQYLRNTETQRPYREQAIALIAFCRRMIEESPDPRNNDFELYFSYPTSYIM